MIMGNSILCSKEEADVISANIQQEADKLCEQFNAVNRPQLPISVRIMPIRFPMGWGLKSQLLFGDDIIEEYPMAELVILDLQALTMR